MAMIKVRVGDELADAFAVTYPGRGERSTLLRRAVQMLVDQKEKAASAQSQLLKPPPTLALMQTSPKGQRRSMRYDATVRLSVRLTPEQYTGIEHLAGQLGMPTGSYVRALVDAQLSRAPEWAKEPRKELTEASSQLRMAGVNLNQLTFLCQAAMKDGRPFPLAKDELAQALEAVNDLKASFLAVLTSRDSYWSTKGRRDE